MKSLREELTGWLPEARRRARQVDVSPSIEHVGTVERIDDGVAMVSGLPYTRLDELLSFEDGTQAQAVQVSQQSVGCVLLGSGQRIRAGGKVRGTGNIVKVPVGEALLGRVINSMGTALDGGTPINAQRQDPIERAAPGIVDRELVTQPLLTGLTVIDAMIPLGRGQRELIIGDRKTGKTAVAVDTMINQRHSDVICVFAAVGQKASTVNRVLDAVHRYGAMERCVFVIGEAEAPPGAQWITPYAACSIAEYFRDQGRDVLLVIDDLTKHAAIHRQLALLLRRPPGREAYPGDVFHLHARLLERAAKLSPRLGGGSLTALPIAETEAGNLTAYIPTNLISITDGQIYLENKLFYEGQKPAVNVGMSVSRVGGQTQAPVMKQLAKALRLEYAQFLELEVFTRFGAMVDERTRKTIEHGRRIRAILTQAQYKPLGLAQQAVLLLAVAEGSLDAVPVDRLESLRGELDGLLQQQCARILARIEQTGELSDEDRQELVRAISHIVQDMKPTNKAD